jgi:hypothetical protein
VGGGLIPAGTLRSAESSTRLPRCSRARCEAPRLSRTAPARRRRSHFSWDVEVCVELDVVAAMLTAHGRPRPSRSASAHWRQSYSGWDVAVYAALDEVAAVLMAYGRPRLSRTVSARRRRSHSGEDFEVCAGFDVVAAARGRVERPRLLRSAQPVGRSTSAKSVAVYASSMTSPRCSTARWRPRLSRTVSARRRRSYSGWDVAVCAGLDEVAVVLNGALEAEAFVGGLSLSAGPLRRSVSRVYAELAEVAAVLEGAFKDREAFGVGLSSSAGLPRRGRLGLRAREGQRAER